MPSTKCSLFLTPVVCALLVPSSTCAQNSANFNLVTSNGPNAGPANVYAVDVNNDGITDIIQDGGYSTGAFYVSVNNGNGTFAAPVQYTLPVSAAVGMCIAAADYNRDGNVDLAVPLYGTNQIAVYLGNGDGTFKSPILSTINLPSGFLFSEYGCAAADFNADGDIDLVTWTSNVTVGGSSSELYVFQGEANGSFNSSPYPALAGTTGQQQGTQVFVGDYDGDGKTDIATDPQSEDPNTGQWTSTTIYVLYGNNNFTFDNTTPYTYNGLLTIGSGDLNSDGSTDLFALTDYNGGQQYGIFYGTDQRTFNSYWMDTNSTYRIGGGPPAWNWQPFFTMADYNGDGRMDLAALAFNPGTNETYVAVFLAGSNSGEFTTEYVSSPFSGWYTAPGAGLFSGSYLKPDPTFNYSPSSSQSFLTALLNATDGYFGPCEYPHSGKGFHVCTSRRVQGNTVPFSAAVDSFGKVRTIGLWVDGREVQEQHHTWDTHAYFDWAGTFPNGTHKATFYASDVDNTVQRYDFTFTVNGAH